MSIAWSASGEIDGHARKLARAIAKGRLPRRSAELEDYLMRAPQDLIAAFEGMSRHLGHEGTVEPLGLAYLYLLERLLENLRCRVDDGYSDAAELIDLFQSTIVRQVRGGLVDTSLLEHVGHALHEARIAASEEFAETATQYLAAEGKAGGSSTDLQSIIEGILASAEGDLLALAQGLAALSGSMTVEMRRMLVDSLVQSGVVGAGSLSVLFLLDQDRLVRVGIAAKLKSAVRILTSEDLRRLITIRNWRPDAERSAVDAVIRRARESGVFCAPWPVNQLEEIHATCVDGAGAQGCLMVSAAGRKKRLSSILTKGGIVDAWTSEPESTRRVVSQIADAISSTPLMPVLREYLDSIVGHHLALLAEEGKVPPVGLLQVAETIGAVDWQPRRMDMEGELAALAAELPPAMLEPEKVRAALEASGQLEAIAEISESWFEADPETERLASSFRGSTDQKATQILATILTSRRDEWAERVLRAALWLKQGSGGSERGWQELVLVARALAEKDELTGIGLMRGIALRTVEAAYNAVESRN